MRYTLYASKTYAKFIYPFHKTIDLSTSLSDIVFIWFHFVSFYQETLKTTKQENFNCVSAHLGSMVWVYTKKSVWKIWKISKKDISLYNKLYILILYNISSFGCSDWHLFTKNIITVRMRITSIIFVLFIIYCFIYLKSFLQIVHYSYGYRYLIEYYVFLTPLDAIFCVDDWYMAFRDA